ncbi:NYN domain-containing protein [Roseovarius arcticus]|uniref:NYN domain-containing protein n=1 Tax=Roseovarius arcticus TaxID=2547404 RepID=UPI0011103477|nr:NYN domain-containing protein [Roseovarius arcticus]
MSAERIALLVDGDNISATHAKDILSYARKLGRVDVARVYGGAHHSCDWLNAPGYRVMHAGAGKNAADVLLCIDAMELALTGGLQTFAVATSDGDFTHLSQRLRERGLHVLGLGEAKAPECFRMACSTFVQLGGEEKLGETKLIPTGTSADFDRRIRAMIQQHTEKGSGMRLVDLAAAMRKKHGTQISTYPERSWRAYLANRSDLYALDPRGPEAMVRYKPAGFAGLPI